MNLVQRFAKENPGALVRASDFRGPSPGAVAKALSRLADSGQLVRAAKGVYFVPKQTLLGPSRPSLAGVVAKTLPGRTRPTGVTAANLLGLSSQVAARPEWVVYGHAQLDPTLVRARRRKGGPPMGFRLSDTDAALLEVLRDRGRYSELSDPETLAHLRDLLAARQIPMTSQEQASRHDATRRRFDSLAFRDLVKAATAEPPRVRAMLGALLEDLKVSPSLWKPLRESLNPLSRFDFGAFRGLPNARQWQAK